MVSSLFIRRYILLPVFEQIRCGESEKLGWRNGSIADDFAIRFWKEEYDQEQTETRGNRQEPEDPCPACGI